MKNHDFIKINDERIKLSSIKRYFPTKINQSIQGNKSHDHSISIKFSTAKESDTYIYKFKNRTEKEKILRKLDKHFNII